MKAFILAGGFATRLWPLTEKRAKPLLPLAGKPIISHLVEDVPEGIPITVSTNKAFENGFLEWQKDMGRKEVEILIEDTQHDDHKLGALGAVAQWITHAQIDDDVLLLTGDNYCGFSMKNFLAAATPDTAILAAHDIQDLETAKSFGTVIVDEDNKTVTAFEEKPAEPKSTLVSTGCSLLPKSTLPVLLEFAKKSPDNVGGIFEELLRKGKPVECFMFSEPWFDIGSFHAYLEATEKLVGNECLLGKNARCEETACEGSVVIGDDSAVEKSTLRNVVIFEGCSIRNCVLENCIIDNSCVLEGVDLTGKMLREQTHLSKSV